MFGLITMLLSTLGATGMGSMLKILGGAVQSRNEAKEAEAKRELIRDMQMKEADLVLLVGLLLLSGCSTLLQSPSSALSTLKSSLSPSSLQSKQKTSQSCGDCSQCQSTKGLQRQSLQDISPSSRLPLWEL
jgi:hypothetical protein